jgi:HK97 family phage portal protein
VSIRSLFGGMIRNEQPVPYVSKYRSAFSGGMGRSAGDRKAELGQYGEIGTLHGVVSKLASMTSLVQWRLYRSSASGLDEDRVEVSRHAALMVWNRPNPFMPGQEFREISQQHLDLTGECWWVLVRSRLTGGTPYEMWPVRPDRIRPVESNTEFIAGYIYRSPDGEEVPLRREDVIMIRNPSPLDIYRGMSPLPALAVDLGAEEAQASWNAAFFRNSAQPGGVIEVDRRLGDDEWEELVTRWNAQHRGVSNAGRVAVLEQSKFVPVAYTQKDMQFVETRGLTKQAILDAYGFPKFGLGDVDDVNRATATASLALMAQTLTVPRLERMKAAANLEFLPQFGAAAKGLEFDYDSPIPPDVETDNATLLAQATAAEKLIPLGFDADEVCDAIGLPRMTFEKPEPTVVKVPSSLGGGSDDPSRELEPA